MIAPASFGLPPGNPSAACFRLWRATNGHRVVNPTFPVRFRAIFAVARDVFGSSRVTTTKNAVIYGVFLARPFRASTVRGIEPPRGVSMPTALPNCQRQLRWPRKDRLPKSPGAEAAAPFKVRRMVGSPPATQRGRLRQLAALARVTAGSLLKLESPEVAPWLRPHLLDAQRHVQALIDALPAATDELWRFALMRLGPGEHDFSMHY